MRSYTDTGFLCSLYAPDAHTDKAVPAMSKRQLPLPLVWLHQIEFRNALRLQVFRKAITATQRDASLNALLVDISDGVYEMHVPDLASVTVEAERLSASYSEKLGTRSLDILHVAMALVLGQDEFLTFDKRQAALARAAGLSVPVL